MEPELRHLKTIRAIADAGSLTRAATDPGLAQPALSAQLKRIERALGGALFERGRHGVRATAPGEPVLERSRIMLPAVTEWRQGAARSARSSRATASFRPGGTHGPLLSAVVDRPADVTPDAPVTTCASRSEPERPGHRLRPGPGRRLGPPLRLHHRPALRHHRGAEHQRDLPRGHHQRRDPDDGVRRAG